VKNDCEAALCMETLHAEGGFVIEKV